MICMGDGICDILGCNVVEFGCFGLEFSRNEVMDTGHVKQLAGV